MNKILIGLMSAALITACSAPAVKDTLLIQQSAQQQAKNLGLSAQEVLDETRDLQILAQREDLYFYSPTYIAQAEEEIRTAESAFKDKLATQKIITHALTGQQLLKRGLENKKTVLSQLKLSLDGLALLEELKAPTLFSGDYSDVQSDIKDLIILIEQGNATHAIKEQNAVLNDIADVEIKVLKKTYLGQAEKALDKAIDADAEDFAPASIKKASIAVEKLALFIEQNRKQLQSINDETQKAVHLAQHAEHVAVTVEPLLKLKIKEAEKHVLFIEKLIARIGLALNQQDVTHLPLDNQSIALAQAAETISKQAMAIKQQGQWENEKSELEVKLANLQNKLDNALKDTQQKTSEKIPVLQDNIQTQTKSEETKPSAVPLATEGKPASENTPIVEDNTVPAKPVPVLSPEPIKDQPVVDKNTATEVAETAVTEEVAVQPSTPEQALEDEVLETAEASPAEPSKTNTTATPPVVNQESVENKNP